MIDRGPDWCLFHTGPPTLVWSSKSCSLLHRETGVTASPTRRGARVVRHDAPAESTLFLSNSHHGRHHHHHHDQDRRRRRDGGGGYSTRLLTSDCNCLAPAGESTTKPPAGGLAFVG